MNDLLSPPLLKVMGVSAGYDGRPVVEDCSLSISKGQVALLIGRNGVGKTTLASAISGRIKPIKGTIEFDGRQIQNLPTYKRSRIGIAHVPQGREVIPKMTVRENLVLAAGSTGPSGEQSNHLFKIFPILKDRLHQSAGTLSGGEQQMLAIGRALLSNCRLMILDEPSLGLAPLVSQEVFSSISDLVSKLNLTVLLVEQRTLWARRTGLINYIYILEKGTIKSEGLPEEFDLKSFEEAYLGT